jgi:hypothetical protein
MTTENIFLVENLGHFLIQSIKLKSKKISDGLDEVLHDRLILYNV